MIHLLSDKIWLGVIGLTPFIGGEMSQALVNHPMVEINSVHRKSYVGNFIYKSGSALVGNMDLMFTDQILNEIDVRSQALRTTFKPRIT